MDRVGAVQVPSGVDRSALVRFESAEDVLLYKLVWFKLGNEVSERQWKD